MSNYLADSDLVVVYDRDDRMVGHMWYSTYVHIHEGKDSTDCMYRLEYSKWNCPENVEEWESKHELG
jgi:hypothetical protein